MRLHDVESEVLGMLVHYLYCDELDKSRFSITDIPGEPFDDYDYLVLAKLWKLGERFLMADLQNEVTMDLLEQRDELSKDRERGFRNMCARQIARLRMMGRKHCSRECCCM